jgi:asparagine synthase (glutamine-hydrolysing)
MLGLASTYSDKPLTAFTIAFNDKKYDESPGAREMAKHVKAEHHVIDVSENELADHFAESVWHGETIQYNAHGPARFLLSRAIRQAGYKAVMGGEGADEIFAGYGFVRGAVLASNSSGILPKWLKLSLRLLRPMNQTERRVARTSPWLARLSRLFALPAWASSGLVEWLELLRSIIAADYLAQFQGRDPYRVFFSNFDARAKLFGREPAKQIIYLWLRSLFVNYHLAADRLDMAHAVEVRLPFLDHKLFEFASQIPVSLLAKGGQQKYVLREMGRPYVTDSVYSGAKKPFWAPPSTLQRESKLFELIQDTLRGSVMTSIPFFDQAAVVALLDKLPTLDEAVRGPLDPILMMMASMCFLHERFGL